MASIWRKGTAFPAISSGTRKMLRGNTTELQPMVFFIAFGYPSDGSLTLHHPDLKVSSSGELGNDENWPDSDLPSKRNAARNPRMQPGVISSYESNLPDV
jgi:hypothetical protein